ncbi:cytochrome P450 [Xylariaceae sp. FL0255]|nr:cytochrome P450 [Xylariaceae sp. FL0255]
MELPTRVPSSWTWAHGLTIIAVLLLTGCFYRLYLHPLAAIPGPALAAITRYYEAYYDIIRPGQYTFKIAELHMKYGPIIRISPHEIHVSDPNFFEKLYTREGVWDKYAWSYDAFGAPLSTICTIDHNVHRQRRAALNPYFSKANVTNRQAIIYRNVTKLCDRLKEYAGSTTRPLSLRALTSCYTQDVGTEYILGKSHNTLETSNLDLETAYIAKGSGIWRITKHIRWFGPAMKSLPISLHERMASDGMKRHIGFIKDMIKTSSDIHTAYIDKTLDPDAPHNMVHSILNSGMSANQKTFQRVFEEVGTVTGASFETTATTLRMILCHVYSDSAVLKRLRHELYASRKSESSDLDLTELEQLPYLTAVLMEGLRLSPGVSSRAARVAPDRDLFYNKWRIPAGTPVGMTTLLMHKDPALYPDPDRFDPTRWDSVDKRRATAKGFAPFSRGTRNCLGMHLAWAELYMTVAEVVQQFDLEFGERALDEITCKVDDFTIGVLPTSRLAVTVKKAKA